MEEKLFLFGTGKISKSYTEILCQMSIEIYGYIDNDINKWGTEFYGKKIFNPNILKSIDKSQIIIACSDTKSIIKQLIELDIQDKIVSIDHIKRKGIERIQIDKSNMKQPYNKNSSKKNIIIDNFDGSWGGAEDWAHKVASSLIMRGYEVVIVESNMQETVEGLEYNTIQIDRKNKQLVQVYTELINFLVSILPFTLFNIWSSELLWAASYVKKLYPQSVQIISSVLNDNNNTYQRLCEWDDNIDLYLCISSRIMNNLKSLYGININKLQHRVPFVENLDSFERTYQICRKVPLAIGYPCRLVYNQKRADLIPKLIENMENKHINYMLNIAGNGPCEKELKGYVDTRKLNNKVKFYGRLTKKDLIDFLKKQDIYLNFSEYEGTSLTMLEAMACGCVPVVTNVSGVNDFIVSGQNGLISDVGNIDDIADNIAFLEQNRKKIEEYGKKCPKIVQSNCNIDNYMDYVADLIS